jgi:protein-tyrosine phosphatase
MTNNLLDFVTDRLATGRSVETKEHVAELLTHGITHVIDVWDAKDHTNLLVEARIIPMRPYPPMPDVPGTKLPVGWFADSITFALCALVKPRAKVLAHCWGGSNRGPVTAYAIMRAMGLSAVDAEQRIRTSRPGVSSRGARRRAFSESSAEQDRSVDLDLKACTGGVPRGCVLAATKYQSLQRWNPRRSGWRFFSGDYVS